MMKNRIEATMMQMRDESEAVHLMRFFKCGKGEYGEGDRFLGIRVPRTREVVKQFRREVTLNGAVALTESPWHEIRLAGFLLMIEIYGQHKKRKDEAGMKEVVNRYLESLPRGNNWDLVDLVAPKILGEWLLTHPEDREILYELSDCHESLWHQRTAMVATWTLIRAGEFEDALCLAEGFLTHSHDLMHKASGWMLREIGKRGGMRQLLAFLDKYVEVMPRTMLRYSIEKLPESQRKDFLSRPRLPKY